MTKNDDPIDPTSTLARLSNARVQLVHVTDDGNAEESDFAWSLIRQIDEWMEDRYV